VLTRTLEELAAVGLEGLSVERIALRAEVNKTTVYRRWPTREALVAAALEGILGSLAAELVDRGSLRADLLGLLAQVAGLLRQPLGRAVARAALGGGGELAAAGRAARRLTRTPAGPMQALVNRARSRGEWRADVPPALLLSALVGAVIHRALLERAPLGRGWQEALVDLLLEGLRPRAATRSSPPPRTGGRARRPRSPASGPSAPSR
jgi:AcrR family transcriptional regulator